MANDKKQQDKGSNGGSNGGTNGGGNGSATTPPAAGDSVGATALITGNSAAAAKAVAPPKGALVIPTMEEMDIRVEQARLKLQAFHDLRSDNALSEEVRNAAIELYKTADPNKPGMEEVTTGWTLTRINIAQPTTQSAAKPENAKGGDLYTTAGMLLERPLSFIPFWFNEENIMFKQGEKAPECSSPDAKLGAPYGICEQCPYLPFGKQNGGRGDQKKTECQNQIVVAMLASDLSGIYIFQFGKTSRGAGSALISLAKAHPVPWRQSYQLNTEKKTGDLGVYFVAKIEPTGKTNSPDVQKLAQTLSELYGANRKKSLGDFYLRAASSARTAVAAETQFQSEALDLGEPDLSMAAPSPSARTAAKPM